MIGISRNARIAGCCYMTTDEYVMNFTLGILCALFGFYMGSLFFNGQVEYVEVPVYINQTIIKEVPCTLSCLDARNEGYLDGVAECGMNKMYVEAKNGQYQSIDDNINGFNAEGVAICVQTAGRSEGEILAAFMEELFHQHLFAEANRESICLEHEEGE